MFLNNNNKHELTKIIIDETQNKIIVKSTEGTALVIISRNKPFTGFINKNNKDEILYFNNTGKVEGVNIHNDFCKYLNNTILVDDIDPYIEEPYYKITFIPKPMQYCIYNTKVAKYFWHLYSPGSFNKHNKSAETGWNCYSFKSSRGLQELQKDQFVFTDLLNINYNILVKKY